MYILPEIYGQPNFFFLTPNIRKLFSSKAASPPVLEIANCSNHGWGTRDILRGAKELKGQKKVEIYVSLRFLLSVVGGPKPISSLQGLGPVLIIAIITAVP